MEPHLINPVGCGPFLVSGRERQCVRGRGCSGRIIVMCGEGGCVCAHVCTSCAAVLVLSYDTGYFHIALHGWFGKLPDTHTHTHTYTHTHNLSLSHTHTYTHL